jgi:membrane protein implicated in regulation of membrane protease activity
MGIVKSFFRDNGLTITLSAMFLLSLLGMIWSGHAAHNEELQEHGGAAIGLWAYMTSGDFMSALFENWESEFLQMSAYVMLTAVLFQRGSAESRDPDNPERDNDELSQATRRLRPVLSWLYSYSLGIALAVLFAVSLWLHWAASLKAANELALRHGGAAQTMATYVLDPQLWFESFQNWQSEFLSTALLVVLSIFLRHKGSPESKPAGAANSETGA